MISQTLLLLSSVVTTWIIIMACLYVFKGWVYAGFPVSWNRISLWLTVSFLLIAFSLLFLQVVVNNWLSLIMTIIVPRVVCVIGLHMFMILFRAYMTMRYQQVISQFKFLTTLAMVYLLFIGGTWMTLAASSQVLTYFTDMIVYFLLQGSIIGMALVSFLLSGIAKTATSTMHHNNTHTNSTHAHNTHNVFNDDTDQW